MRLCSHGCGVGQRLNDSGFKPEVATCDLRLAPREKERTKGDEKRVVQPGAQWCGQRRKEESAELEAMDNACLEGTRGLDEVPLTTAETLSPLVIAPVLGIKYIDYITLSSLPPTASLRQHSGLDFDSTTGAVPALNLAHQSQIWVALLLGSSLSCLHHSRLSICTIQRAPLTTRNLVGFRVTKKPTHFRPASNGDVRLSCSLFFSSRVSFMLSSWTLPFGMSSGNTPSLPPSDGKILLTCGI